MPPAQAPLWTSTWAALAGGHMRQGLESIARHTGVPVVIVAAVALVISFRLVRRMSRLFVEVSLAAALIAALTHFGVLTW